MLELTSLDFTLNTSVGKVVYHELLKITGWPIESARAIQQFKFLNENDDDKPLGNSLILFILSKVVSLQTISHPKKNLYANMLVVLL